MFLVAKDKIGKSILAQQIAFCISCGEMFLGEYYTQKGLVIYVQVEGSLPQTRDNFYNMMEGIHLNTDNLKWIYDFGLPLNREDGLKKLCGLIDEQLKEKGLPAPKLIILDPLYMCIIGDLNKQEDATLMCRNFRRLSDRYDCALLITHHEHKLRLNPLGEPIFEGDDAIYGSFVWKAFADHTLLLTIQQDGSRKLTCKTQRTGKVVGKIEMSLLEPTPLLFEQKLDISTTARKVEVYMEGKKGVTIEDIARELMIQWRSAHQAITNLRKANKVEHMGITRPRVWRLK